MLDLRLSPTASTSTPLSPSQSNGALEPSLSRASVTQLLHYIQVRFWVFFEFCLFLFIINLFIIML
jgi:hypothetical protein